MSAPDRRHHSLSSGKKFLLAGTVLIATLRTVSAAIALNGDNVVTSATLFDGTSEVPVTFVKGSFSDLQENISSAPWYSTNAIFDFGERANHMANDLKSEILALGLALGLPLESGAPNAYVYIFAWNRGNFEGTTHDVQVSSVFKYQDWSAGVYDFDTNPRSIQWVVESGSIDPLAKGHQRDPWEEFRNYTYMFAVPAASVPEPSLATMAALTVGCLCVRRRRDLESVGLKTLGGDAECQPPPTPAFRAPSAGP